MKNEKLRAAREAKGWTMEYVSIRLNMTREIYSFWENGHRMPKPGSIVKLCNLFKMSPQDLGLRDIGPIESDIGVAEYKSQTYHAIGSHRKKRAKQERIN